MVLVFDFGDDAPKKTSKGGPPKGFGERPKKKKEILLRYPRAFAGASFVKGSIWASWLTNNKC